MFSCSISIFIITNYFLLGIRLLQFQDPRGRLLRGRPCYGDPFGFIRGLFKAGQVGLSWLSGCGQCSSLMGQQDTARSSACSTRCALGTRQPQQWSLCGRRWPGRGEKVSASLPETPVEQHKLLCEPKELWNMSWPPPVACEGPPKCFPLPQLHPS